MLPLLTIKQSILLSTHPLTLSLPSHPLTRSPYRLADRPMYTLVYICIHLAVGVTFYICMETPQFKPITHLPYHQPIPLTIYLVPGGFTTRRDSGGYVATFECILLQSIPLVFTVIVLLKVPFLGLRDRDFIYCARWVGGRTMPDGHHFDFYLKWYGDAPHLARSVRRNLAYDSRCLLYHPAANNSQQCAAMEVLQELQKMYPRRDAAFLTEVVAINRFRDQKGDAAYAMIEDRPIEMLKDKRPISGAATALYLTSYNYVLEPWVNPNMTNPMTITYNSWKGYALCRLQEIYAVQSMGLDKDVYIPSYQVMRTTAAMAHSAVTHCLDVHLNFRHRLDASWSQAALRGGTTFPLEGFHSEGRTGSVSKASAGDCNFTCRKWTELVSKLMRIRARQLKVALHGWTVRAARNMQRTDKITTLRRL